MSNAARELLRLDGNRIWRVETAHGPVLQKLYAERGSWLHAWGRELASRLRGGKTGTRASARRATEARLLALWREHGCDVPTELSARHPELASARTLVLEFVDGPLLSALLADPALPRGRRDALIERFAADVAARHARALQHGEAALVQEHGGVQHVLVAARSGAAPAKHASAPRAPETDASDAPAGVSWPAVASLPVSALRFTSFDLENTFRPRRDLAPLIAKELAACLRSLARCGKADGERQRLDVEAFVRGYADRSRLQAAATYYLRHPSPAWRLVWSIDRRREQRRGRPHGKYVMMLLLDAVLHSATR